MHVRLPSEALSKAEYTHFLQHHTTRLSLVLQTRPVSQLLNRTFPTEYVYLTQDLCSEERWALCAVYKGTLRLLPQILDTRSKMGTGPVSDKQQSNIELALSVLHRSAREKASQMDEAG